MNKTLAAILALAIAGPAQAQPRTLQAWQQATLDALKKEKQVLDATWSTGSILWVGMRHDGTRRDGYAQHVCNLMHQAGLPEGSNILVKVLDQASVVRGENLREIGRTDCRKGRSVIF